MAFAGSQIILVKLAETREDGISGSNIRGEPCSDTGEVVVINTSKEAIAAQTIETSSETFKAGSPSTREDDTPWSTPRDILTSCRTETSPTRRRGANSSQLSHAEKSAPTSLPKRMRSTMFDHARHLSLKKDEKNPRRTPKESHKLPFSDEQSDWTPNSSPLKYSDNMIDAGSGHETSAEKYGASPQPRFHSTSDAETNSTQSSKADAENDINVIPDCCPFQHMGSIHCTLSTEPSQSSSPSIGSDVYNHVSPCVTPNGKILDPFVDISPPPFELVNDVSPVAYMTTPTSFNITRSRGLHYSRDQDQEIVTFWAEKEAAQNQILSKDLEYLNTNSDTLSIDCPQFIAGDDIFSDPFMKSVLEAGAKLQAGLRGRNEGTLDCAQNPFADPCPLHTQDPMYQAGNQEAIVTQLGVDDRSTVSRTGCHDALAANIDDSMYFVRPKKSRKLRECVSCTELLPYRMEPGSLRTGTDQTHRCNSSSITIESVKNCQNPFTEDDEGPECISPVRDAPSDTGHSRKASIQSLQSGIVRVKSFFTVRSHKKRARACSADSDVQDRPHVAEPIKETKRTASRAMGKHASYLPRLVQKASRRCAVNGSVQIREV